MESKKTSKKTVNTADKAVPSSENLPTVVSKPVQSAKATESRRPTRSAARTQESSSEAGKISTPKQASHRHSKVTVPAAPVVEEVVAEVIVPKTGPVHHEDVARLAYTFWEQRNYAHGFAEEDWHKALKTLSAAG